MGRLIRGILLDNPTVALISAVIAAGGALQLTTRLLASMRTPGPEMLGLILLFLVLVRTAVRDAHSLVPQPRRIRAGLGHQGSPYYFSQFLDASCRAVTITAQNLRTLLSDHEFLPKLNSLLQHGTEVTLILTTYEAVKSINPTSAPHFVETVRQLRDLRNQLPEGQKRKLHIYFHPGASSLSTLIRDPGDRRRAALVFTPKFANDEQPGNRIYCAVEKREHEDLFNRINGSVARMTQADSYSLDDMIHMIGPLG